MKERILFMDMKREGREEGRSEGREELSMVIRRLNSGESKEELIASGISKDVIIEAEELLSSILAV